MPVSLAIIVGTLLLLLQPVAGVHPSSVFQEQAEQQTQTPASPAPDQKAAPAAEPAQTNPCPEATASNSPANSNCKPTPPARRKSRKRKLQDSSTGSGKTVVRNGSTTDAVVAISPTVNQQQASRQVQTTNQWLTKTEANLKLIEGRQLNPAQQDTAKQIGSYVEQAKTALKNGDVERAYNLARKANTLSADLLAH